MNTTQTAELYSHFKSGHDGDKDSEGSDCPSSSWTDDSASSHPWTKAAHDYDAFNILGLPQFTRQSTLTTDLKTRYTAVQFVPYLLNDNRKQKPPCCVQAAGASGQKTGTF